VFLFKTGIAAKKWTITVGKWAGKVRALASKRHRTFINNSDYGCLGFVVSESDPFTVIDKDYVIDPETGKINDEASEEIELLNSYTEKSVSGRGIHVFVKAKSPKAGRKKKQPDGTDREMYSSLRSITMTGNHLEGTPLTINPRQEVVDQLWKKWFSDDTTEIKASTVSLKENTVTSLAQNAIMTLKMSMI
jgi:putative DNA primase/helicase